jgi:predicted permease
MLLAWWSLDLLLAGALTRYGAGDVLRLAVDVTPDARVLAFSLLLALGSGIAFGLVPALRATRPDLITVIKDEGANLSSRSGSSWLRRGLVIAQVSLCLLLLIPAGLLLRSLQRVLAADPGFEMKQLLLLGYSLELSGYDSDRAKLFQQRLISRVASLPGVHSVSFDRRFEGRAMVSVLEERTTNTRQFGPAPFEGVSENYLETIGTPLLQGRGFTAEEVAAKAPVLIISETTAHNIWPNQNAIGKTVRLERQLRDGSEIIFPVAQVIGIARDNQTHRVGETPPLFFYRPEVVEVEMDTSLLVRTKDDASRLKELVRKEAYSLEQVLRFFVRTAEEDIAKDESVRSARAASEGTSLLGGLALLLAALGIYGVMAWTVAQRTHEIGIRMALGAQRRDVLALVLKQGMKLVLIGVVIGVPLSLAVTQLLKGLLFGLSTTDPLAFSLIIVILMSVAGLACYIPARRATKVDPVVSLRYE